MLSVPFLAHASFTKLFHIDYLSFLPKLCFFAIQVFRKKVVNEVLSENAHFLFHSYPERNQFSMLH